MNGGQIGLCTSGKAKIVKVNGKRLFYACLDGRGEPIKTATDLEPLAWRGKQRLLHLESGAIFNSLAAFCDRTGVPRKRAQKYLDGEKVDLLGQEFEVLNG